MGGVAIVAESVCWALKRAHDGRHAATRAAHLLCGSSRPSDSVNLRARSRIHDAVVGLRQTRRAVAV